MSMYPNCHSHRHRVETDRVVTVAICGDLPVAVGWASDNDSVGDSRRSVIDDDVCLTMNTYLSYHLCIIVCTSF